MNGMLKKGLLVLIGLAMCVSVFAAEPAVNLVPWPQLLSMGGGEMVLSGSSQVVYSHADLAGLAQIVAEEVEEATRLQLTATQGSSPSVGDIYLTYTTDPSVTGEAYKVTVGASATAEAGNYNAVAMASVTLIQAIKANGGSYSIPEMTVNDAPASEYRGFMVDLARNNHSIDTLKEVVDMCRLYKIRYLQLHLTDDQAFTFPSAAYPALAAYGQTYTLAEMNDLADYADAHGVTIIPEIDVPGHGNCFVLSMPSLFATSVSGSNVINFADTAVWSALDTIIGEVLAVFDTAPYVHLGADEANLGGLDSDPEFINAINTYGVGDIHGLFNYFISHLDDTIKSYGKETIVWEGFDYGKSGNAQMDTDIAVMMFDNYKHPDDYRNAGYPVINASWFPLYVVGHDGFGMDSDIIYQWDLTQFGNYSDPYPRRATATYSKDVTTTTNIPGAQMCSWEMPEYNEIPYVRFRLAPFADRLWNPANANGFDHFDARYQATDLVLDYMLADHQPPTVPSGVAASDSIYEEMVRVGWSLSGNYPVKYALYKNTTNDSSTATLILDTLSKTTTLYEDADVISGQTYYYWVKAWNKWGWSDFSSAGTGRVGVTTLASVYEPFDYTADVDVNGQNGGTGFATAWNQISFNGTVKTVADSLEYPGVPSTGGAMKVTCTSDEPAMLMSRTFNDSTGYDMANVWFSFMVKPENVASGHCFLSLNNAGSIGKAWANGFGIWPNANQQMENGVTYFAVVRYDCRAGTDNIYLWINPDLAQEPSIDNADAFKAEDIGIAGKVGFNIQGYYSNGIYIFDEIRVGSSWYEVIGISNLDPEAPTPNPMTWQSQPALQNNDTEAAMECSVASHASGVEYYFEETTGNPGGDDSGWQTETTYADTGLQTGNVYAYRVKARKATADYNETAWSSTVSVSTLRSLPYGGTPRPIPGVIEFEDYDEGGEGLAYHDTGAGNDGGAYRTDDVDIETCSEGGYSVGWSATGEWLTYTVNVEPGTYDISARVSSPGTDGQITFQIDDGAGGYSELCTLNVPNTGGWQNWQTVTAEGISVPGGSGKVVRLDIAGGFNFNWMEFVKSDCSAELLADIYPDCKIDILDLSVLAANWLADTRLMAR